MELEVNILNQKGRTIVAKYGVTTESKSFILLDLK